MIAEATWHQIFTAHDEALALLLFVENISEGWKELATGFNTYKKKWKTKYITNGGWALISNEAIRQFRINLITSVRQSGWHFKSQDGDPNQTIFHCGKKEEQWRLLVRTEFVRIPNDRGHPPRAPIQLRETEGSLRVFLMSYQTMGVSECIGCHVTHSGSFQILQNHLCQIHIKEREERHQMVPSLHLQD